MRETDDGAFGKWSEVTTVQTVRDAGVDEKNFIVAELSAAAPLRQDAGLAVARFRARDLRPGLQRLHLERRGPPGGEAVGHGQSAAGGSDWNGRTSTGPRQADRAALEARTAREPIRRPSP